MKKNLLLLVVSLMGITSKAQLSIAPNQTAIDLVNALVATSGTAGVVVSNAVLTCDTNANGLFSGTSNLGIANGIVLGTGQVATSSLTDFGIDGTSTDFATTALNTPGDATLNSILTMPTYDACVLEFDLQPVGTYVEFEYVFGSEEYPAFNCTAFNDIFGFFISGPGYSTPTNIALIPSTTTPVSINSINDGTGGCSTYTNLYVTNTGSTSTINGFTTPLLATATVTPSATYHLKMAIADVSDMAFNSYVILQANSLKSGNTTPNAVSDVTTNSGIEIYPTTAREFITLKNLAGASYKLDVYGLNGQHELSSELSKDETVKSISINTLAAGMHLLKMTNKESGKVYTSKFERE